MFNDLVILYRFNGYSMLKKAVKKLAAVPGSPAIESKSEFIKIVVQMFRADSSLMSTQYPTFQKRNYAMYTRQKMGSRNRGTLNYSYFMRVSLCFQSSIAFPAIRNNNAPRLNRPKNERVETFFGSIRNSKHANPSYCFPVFLRGNHNQRFFKCLSASYTFFKTTQISFINLYSSRQEISTRPDHGSSDLMEPSPCGFITSKAQNALKSECTCPVFLGNDPPNGPKPNGQRFAGTFKDGSGNYRCLVSTIGTLVQRFSNWPRFFSTATRTVESIWPAQTKQILKACIFIREASLKFIECARIVFHIPTYYM